MAPQEVAATPAPGQMPPAFAQILARLKRGDGGGDDAR